MALTDLTRISTAGIATGTSLSGAILHGDAHFRGTQVGVTSALFDSSDNALEFNDNVKLKLGNSGNFSLYSDGVNGILYAQNDPLYLKGEAVYIQTNNNEASGYFLKNGAVKLYFNGGDPKFETTSTGAVVTGILTATSFSGPLSNASGISTFYDLRVSNNLTVEGTTTTLDTNLIGVDRVEVGANSNTVTGIAVTQSGSADILNLSNANGEQVTVLSSGNVGIGSAVPELDLDVTRVSSGDNVIKVQNRASALSLIKYPNVNNPDVRAGSDYGSFAVYTGGDSGSRKLKVEHGGDVKIENGGLTVTGEVTVNSTVNQPLVLNNTNTNGQSSISFQSAGSTKYNLGSNKDADGNIDFFIYDQVNNEHRFNINASGSVGIGTDIPSALLHLHKTSGTALAKLENTNGTSQLDIRHTNGYGAVHYIHQGTEKWRVGQTAQSDHFSIYQSTGASGLPYRLFIQNNGEVGINTSDPDNTLHLLRNSVNHGIKLERGGTNAGSASINVTSFGALNLVAANNLVLQSGGSQQIIFNRGGSTEVARFDTNGRLGINTTAPQTKLEVSSATGTRIRARHTNTGGGRDAGFDIWSDDSGTFAARASLVHSGSAGRTTLYAQNRFNIHSDQTDTSLFIARDGEVGIGTDSPSAKTHIYDSTNTSSVTEQFRISGGDRTAATFETGFRFFTQSPSANGNRHVRFTSNGNTGLTIQPYETSTGNAATDRNILLCPDGGTIGINDSTPNTYFKLDVNGHTNIVGDVALPTTNRIYFGNSDTAFIKGEHGASGYLAFGANNEKMRLTRAGNLSITDGNLVVASGHGIDFSATADSAESGSTMSSELLDDYEEGTATFALHINGSEASGVSYSYNTAPYVKVGRIVYCAISMFATSVPSDTGVIDIVGLPFQDGGGGGYREPAFLAGNHGGVSPNGTVITGAMHGSGTKIRIRKNGNQDLDGSDIGGTFWMHGHITYMST